MLLINKSGRIFDVPEQVAEQYVATGSNASREAVGDMLATLRSQVSVPSDTALDGCCNIYANYCPNR